MLDFCAAGQKLRFYEPAQPNLAGIKRLAVAPCAEQDEAKLLCGYLQTAFSASDYFELFDQNKLTAALEQQRLSYESLRSSDSSAQIGKIIQIDGILFASLKKLELFPDEMGVEKVPKSVWTGEYERDTAGNIIEEVGPTGEMVKKKKYKLQTVEQHFRIRKAQVIVNFELINLKSGQQIFLREKIDNYTSEKLIIEDSPKLPSDDEIKRTLLAKTVRNFLAEIWPKTNMISRQIEKTDIVPDSAMNWAKSGDWKKAQRFWERQQKKSPTDARIYYNLGLALEAQGDYESAERFYMQASLLNNKQKLYQKAIQNLRKRWLTPIK
ncbi:MAG: tetratricopeptide repeat protein [candidate division KSB1 bacterium]|nr:tetratricopeptide repeat protein [candidate division KSB1 bacterium]MDZ7318917.1 tetratricopeptide repeat protein [candidate division KSB1 bacterium]MDZ7342365.1 tetratricopeptide repeat protein [candidate division KSB1 bacterium]